MHEANTVHPRHGPAQLGPYPAEDAFSEALPRSVGVEESEEVAAGEVG